MTIVGVTDHDVRRFATMTVDVCCKAVEIGGQRKRLTKAEFSVLELLTRRPGALFSRSQIMDAVYGHDEGYYSDRTVDSHIKRIRKQGIPGIICHHGSGYCWEDGKPAPKLCDHCGAPI